MRHVVAGMTQDEHPIEHAGNEAHPLLIEEEALPQVEEAVRLAAHPPPFEKAVHLRPASEREEPQVERAYGGDERRSRMPPIVDGSGEVRRQDHIPGVELREQLTQRPEHAHVGVEEDEAVVPSLEEPLQERRLDRRAQLDEVVAKTHLAPRRDAETLEREDAERLRGILTGAVHEKHVQLGFRMMAAERLRQHPRLGQVVPGHDSAEGGSHPRHGL